MPNDFVNTVTASNGTTYDIYDKRLNVTAADVGKVISVDEEGNLVLKNMTFYQHFIRGRAMVGEHLRNVTILIVATFSTPFTGIDSYGELQGGGPLKQIVTIQAGDMMSGLPFGIYSTIQGDLRKPLDENPTLMLWVYNSGTMLTMKPYFTSDTVTELES